MKLMEKFRKIREKFRHGLVLQVIHDRLAKYGVEITPYWLVKECINNCSPNHNHERFKEFSFGFFGPEEMKVIGAIPWVSESEEVLLQKLKEGRGCYGAKYNDEIAAFIFYDFKECISRICPFTLKDNEAYLLAMYNMEKYRGRGLATYLREEILKKIFEMGKDTCYSITECLNTPSRNVKRKLDVQPIKLGLYVNLFSKIKRNWTIKKYKIEKDQKKVNGKL